MACGASDGSIALYSVGEELRREFGTSDGWGVEKEEKEGEGEEEAGKSGDAEGGEGDEELGIQDLEDLEMEVERLVKDGKFDEAAAVGRKIGIIRAKIGDFDPNLVHSGSFRARKGSTRGGSRPGSRGSDQSPLLPKKEVKGEGGVDGEGAEGEREKVDDEGKEGESEVAKGEGEGGIVEGKSGGEEADDQGKNENGEGAQGDVGGKEVGEEDGVTQAKEIGDGHGGGDGSADEGGNTQASEEGKSGDAGVRGQGEEEREGRDEASLNLSDAERDLASGDASGEGGVDRDNTDDSLNLSGLSDVLDDGPLAQGALDEGTLDDGALAEDSVVLEGRG